MRHGCTILVVLLFLSGSTAIAGAGPVSAQRRSQGPADPSQSAALFVGVRDFDYDQLAPVMYAVDDAVDLAYAFSIEGTPRLVEPARVMLALSGQPQKPESQQRLGRLLEAGATVYGAGHSKILSLLMRQSAAVGANGLLIVGFATHGISRDGIQHLLAQDSLLQHLDTAPSETKVRDIVADAKVPRAVIFLDACRERLMRDARTGYVDPRSAKGMLRKLGDVNGLVVLSAAVPGGYAYDDDALRNGVFTHAVLEGLRCRASRDANGHVTVDKLAEYVETRVLLWIREHKKFDARFATQLQCEGASKKMPLSMCAIGTR